MTTGRIIVAVLLLAALGVLIKLVLFLLGIYQPSPANIRPLYPDAQSTPAQAAAPAAPVAPQPEPNPEPAPAPQPEPQPAPRAVEPEPEPAPADPQPLVTPQPQPDPQTEAVVEPEPEPEQKAADAAPAGESEGAPSVETGGTVRYVVQPGDTLWAIARQSCGAGARYDVLYRNNSGHIKNPHRIWPQQVIEIPGDCR